MSVIPVAIRSSKQYSPSCTKGVIFHGNGTKFVRRQPDEIIRRDTGVNHCDDQGSKKKEDCVTIHFLRSPESF